MTGGRATGDAASRGAYLAEVARYAADAGVDVMQIRERDLEGGALAAVTTEVLAAVEGSALRVVVNDRLDVALAAGAHGVHLRADSIPPARARVISPPGFIIGRSVHGVDEAKACAADADYLIAGTVWATPSKPGDHPLLSVEGLAAIVRSVKIPVLAIGGVTGDRLPAAARAGAAGVAGIRLFADKGIEPAPLVDTVRGIRRAFDIT